MVHSLNSITLIGMKPQNVTCEVDLTYQIPSISIIGLASQLTMESKERVKSAVINSSFDWPARKVTINLLPAALPKFGAHFELCMALTVLACQYGLPVNDRKIFVIGECSLTGDVRPCGWLSRCSDFLVNQNAAAVIAHEDDIKALDLLNPELKKKIELISVNNVKDAWNSFVEIQKSIKFEQSKTSEDKTEFCFNVLSEVTGEKLGVISALLAIGSKCSVLYAGPHGRGKSMLIKAILESQKTLNKAQITEKNAINAMLGMTNSSNFLPVVYIQPNITKAGLEGSISNAGQIISGELTSAHYGILVADEFLEFRQDVIESLRVPLEEKKIMLQRAKFKAELPCDFQLLASTNLCKCGNIGSQSICRCGSRKQNEYIEKCSGPIFDRFDMTLFIGTNQDLKIPKSLTDLVSDILNYSKWNQRCQKLWNQISNINNLLIEEVHNELKMKVMCSFKSKRSQIKCINLAKLIANFCDQKLNNDHINLAICLKQELIAPFRANNGAYLDKRLLQIKYNDNNNIN